MKEERFDLGGRLVVWTAMGVSGLPRMFDAWKDGLAKAAANPRFRDIVKDLSIDPPEGFADARSVVVAAFSMPPRRVPLEWRGRSLEWQQPPQYYRLDVRRDDVRDAIASRLGGDGPARLVAADDLPLKFLAAWTGIGRYGRNNIVQVPGLGTALTLVAWWCDRPVGESEAGPARFLEACEKCDLCARLCPTGAIPGEPGIIDASRCVSLYNEDEGDVPDWIPAECFHATNGCAICQRSCPENVAYRDSTTTLPVFTEDEVESLLAGGTDDDSSRVLAKLVSTEERAVLEAFAKVIASNLRRFLDRHAA